MSVQGQNLPDYQHPEGDYRHIFSYHPMNVEIARAEGVYIFDDKDNRYFDASGGPFAVNLPHNHPRMKAAIADQLDKYAYTHPVLSDPLRAKFCRKLSIKLHYVTHFEVFYRNSEKCNDSVKLTLFRND